MTVPATRDIARGLHIIEDATAPAHSGFQPWYGALNPLGAGIHAAKDIDPSRYDPQAVPRGIENSERFIDDYLHGRGQLASNYLPQSPCGP